MSKLREALRVFDEQYTSTLTEAEREEAGREARKARELAGAKTAKERNAIRRKYRAKAEGAVKRREDEDEDEAVMPGPKGARKGSVVYQDEEANKPFGGEPSKTAPDWGNAREAIRTFNREYAQGSNRSDFND